MITFLFADSRTHCSRRPEGVTQTGHPGPEISSAPAKKSRSPYLAIAIVCVPHTSIIFIF
jgi:hypothetical protein